MTRKPAINGQKSEVRSQKSEFGGRVLSPGSCFLNSAAPGFTLIELLAAMAILGLMMVLLFTAFSQASRAWLQGENRVETFTSARAALDLMSRELSQAMVNNNLQFYGDTNTVDFIAPVNAAAIGVDLTGVAYRLNGKNLERGTVLCPIFYNDPDGWPMQAVYTVLAENIMSLKLQFLRTNSTTFGTDWDSKSAVEPGMVNRAPLGVEITIRATDSRAKQRNYAGAVEQTFTTFIAIPNRQP